MEITILGSGTGMPSLKRNASGISIKIEKDNLLFDTGPGTIKRLLEIAITYHDINYIFYTHFHTDHTLDLATLLFAARYPLSLRTKKLTIFGSPGLEKFYNGLLNLYGDVIRPETYQVILREIKKQTLEFDAFRIDVMPMQHTPESIGYRVESRGKSIVYSGDTDRCQNLVQLGQNADILILECSFPNEIKVPGHLVPQEAGKIAQECNCKQLILLHLYPVCQEDEIMKQAEKNFSGKIIVAYDLMKIAL
jgi:ribonuclease BN (tRNA processing enzyme)